MVQHRPGSRLLAMDKYGSNDAEPLEGCFDFHGHTDRILRRTDDLHEGARDAIREAAGRQTFCVRDAPDAGLTRDSRVQERLGDQRSAVFAEVDRGHVRLTPKGDQFGTSRWVRLDPGPRADSDRYPGRSTDGDHGLIDHSRVERLKA